MQNRNQMIKEASHVLVPPYTLPQGSGVIGGCKTCRGMPNEKEKNSGLRGQEEGGSSTTTYIEGRANES